MVLEIHIFQGTQPIFGQIKPLTLIFYNTNRYGLTIWSTHHHKTPRNCGCSPIISNANTSCHIMFIWSGQNQTTPISASTWLRRFIFHTRLSSLFTVSCLQLNWCVSVQNIFYSSLSTLMYVFIWHIRQPTMIRSSKTKSCKCLLLLIFVDFVFILFWVSFTLSSLIVLLS